MTLYVVIMVSDFTICLSISFWSGMVNEINGRELLAVLFNVMVFLNNFIDGLGRTFVVDCKRNV